MSDYEIMCTTINQEYNYEVNRYITLEHSEKKINDTCYDNMTSKETIKFFRSLGGREQVTRKHGRVTKIVSTSPSGELRTIRTFKFISL